MNGNNIRKARKYRRPASVRGPITSRASFPKTSVEPAIIVKTIHSKIAINRADLVLDIDGFASPL